MYINIIKSWQNWRYLIPNSQQFYLTFDLVRDCFHIPHEIDILVFWRLINKEILVSLFCAGMQLFLKINRFIIALHYFLFTELISTKLVTRMCFKLSVSRRRRSWWKLDYWAPQLDPRIWISHLDLSKRNWKGAADIDDPKHTIHVKTQILVKKHESLVSVFN